MRIGLFLSFLLLPLTTAAACSEKSEPGSCYRDKDNACAEYGAAQSAAGKRLCSGMKWTPGAQSCPTANRVGTCVGKNSVAEYLYAGAPNNYSAAGAKSACEASGGAFTPL
jgi:hypothetical protein